MQALIQFILKLLGRAPAPTEEDIKAISAGGESPEGGGGDADPDGEVDENQVTGRHEKPEVHPGDEDIDAAEGHEEYRGLLEKEPEHKTTEEWGLQDVELVLKDGDSGGKVRQYQKWLEALGYELSRFGADGGFGDETLSETREFQDDHDLVEEEDALKLRGVGRKTYDAVQAQFEKLPKKVVPAPPSTFTPPSNVPVTLLEGGVKLYDITEHHGGKKRKRKRKWKDVKGITLHQTATLFGNNVMRYKNISAQVGVTPDGKVVLMNPLTSVVYHGNSFNAKDVGIEIDGHFAGIEGNLKTYWRPKSKPNRQPVTVTEAQIKATLAVIKWIIDTVEAHGGKVEYIHAHRQSSKSRVSDPGSKVWDRIALEAKKRYGLVDGGPTFKVGGYPIPKDWDPTYTAKYRSW